MYKTEEGEHIVKVVRRHYLVILPKIITIAILTLVPLVLYVFLSSEFLPLDDSLKSEIQSFLLRWKVFGYSLWLLVLWVFLFMEWTNYYLDLWVITDRRIVDIDQKSFFHREVTSFRYEQIQDITVETKGFIGTFLKFGTLHIQTAGHNREILIRDAHHPEEARSLILSLSEARLKSTQNQ